MKKIILLVISLFVFSYNVKASDDITIYIFHGSGCGYCKNALSFLKPYAEETDGVKLVEYEVWGSQENKELMYDIATILDVNVTGVPFIVIGKTPIKGFGSGDDENIKSVVSTYKESGYEDVVKKYLNGEISLDKVEDEEERPNIKEDTAIDNTNEYSSENEVKSDSFDIKKAAYAFCIGAVACIILLAIVNSLQNKKRTYEE